MAEYERRLEVSYAPVEWEPENPPILLGTVVEPYGEVVAVGYVGERYYWLERDGVVSMILAEVVEKMAQGITEYTF